MATQTLNAMLSHNPAVTLQEQHVRNREVNQTSGVMPATIVLPGRRCEARMEYQCRCPYEVLEAIDEE